MDTRTRTSSEFEANRQAVEHVLRQQQLRALLKEFFTVQHSFHQRINQFVTAFYTIFADLTDKQQELLQILIRPYKVLMENPFATSSSGKLEQDITHIVSVINARNMAFVRMMPAISGTLVRLEEFQGLLGSIEADPKRKEDLLSALNLKSWMEVESRTLLPNQRLMQYRLLLETIKKEIDKSGCDNGDQLMQKINDALTFILPELRYINENRDVLRLMFDIEKIVSDLAGNPVLQHNIVPGERMTFEQKADAVKSYVANIAPLIMKHEGSVEDHLTGLSLLLREIKTNIEHSKEQEQQMREQQAAELRERAYVVQGYYQLSSAVSWTLFGDNSEALAVKDPRNQLLKLMENLELEIRKYQSVREGYEFLVNKHGGSEPPALRI